MNDAMGELDEVVDAIEGAYSNAIEKECACYSNQEGHCGFCSAIEKARKQSRDLISGLCDKVHDGDLLKACKATLLFHGAGHWDDEKRLEWLNLTGHSEATTKVLCDFVRAALAKGQS